MDTKTIKTHVNLKDYFDKMSPEDAAAITTMCLEQLTAKANELKDLYVSLAKTYGFEMGVCGITCIVQVSAKDLPISPTIGLLGTADGIKNGLAKLMTNGLKQLAEMNKEKQDADKEQG